MSRDHIRKERKVRHVCYSDTDNNAFVQTQVTYPENDHKAKAESLRLSRKVTSHSSRHVIYQTSLHGRETRREERGW